ncbi:GNAT family N-acetyltransferase [Herbaspirillum sp. RU 5E]|uniref:N-acetyltransferase n=2 Tax=Oxalobacteraceae TaxID=75682 RepID=A0A225SW09_9BURK|nr:GNAT family N-acetyltransferase [Herbaspirillum sp. RU 5E]MRT27970.1 GNAT family N-acetyltransferase [Herbaspirillum sp. CAH-3]NUT60730.1 GNAT family N-acetyltransferase [Herbaspirillum sp. C9C3]OWY33762.1 N-acetyltransferase [Herbaspirillum aquaticum]
MSSLVSMTEEVLFRRARKGDAASIAGVRIDAWRAAYRGLVPDSYLDHLKPEESVKLWEQVLEASSDAACTFVAESGGEIIGFASGMTLAESRFGCDAELTAICVLPDEQRKGLGKRLLANVAATLISAGATGLMAWVLSKNEGAGEFFESLGAERLYEQTFTWDDGSELDEIGFVWRKLHS